MKRITGIFIFCIIYLAVSIIHASSNTNQIGASEVKTVIFINMSEACRCIVEECSRIRADLKIILAGHEYTKVTLIEADISTEPEIAYKLIEKYDLQFPPGLAVIDNKGNPIYRAAPNYDKDEFIKALKALNVSPSETSKTESEEKQKE